MPRIFVEKYVRFFMVTLKTKAQPDTPVSSGRTKAVFVITVVENVFESSEKPKVKLIIFQFERISRCQVAAPIAVKPINVC